MSIEVNGRLGSYENYPILKLCFSLSMSVYECSTNMVDRLSVINLTSAVSW